MGTNTDAILFYGFHNPDEDGWLEILGPDWRDLLCTVSGHPPPSVGYDTDANKTLHAAYWKKQAKILEAEPCEGFAP